MSNLKFLPPKYGLHKQSGKARVIIRGHDILLPGAFNSPESVTEYNRLVRDAFGRRPRRPPWKPPKYRRHKQSGHAGIRANGELFLLPGIFNSPESRLAYERLLDELKNKRRLALQAEIRARTTAKRCADGRDKYAENPGKYREKNRKASVNYRMNQKQERWFNAAISTMKGYA